MASVPFADGLASKSKWNRSAARFPQAMNPESQPEFERVILGHRQFQNA